jgi:type VI secretion system protein ImpK
MDRIDELTADCFNFLIQLRRTDPNAQPPPESVQQRMRSLIENMQRRGLDLNLSREDILEISYAIVALADEVAVYYGSQNLRQFWLSRPLQLSLFQTNVAGDQFYDRLAALRQDPRRIEVVRVYYMCLVLGFQGKYRVQGGEAPLQAEIDRLAGDLGKANLFGPEQLSQHGERPPGEAVSGTKAALPIVGLAVGAVVIALVFYVALRVSLSNEVSSVLDRITQLVDPRS